ncbi:FHA domain-containing protein [Holophaga foetida]|uniref:FHA domain-containing protein n=1 Tax=Holophaga foetida TaxID=35839 RepID=UPI000247426C|nr:FHA domain-containing protein [Holophaga foetida]
MSDGPCLILVGTGGRVPLAEGLTVGRGPDNALRLDDGSVSSHHAVFRCLGGNWMLQDLGSTNGTWVNEERVQERVWLKEGDRLRFGLVMAQVGGLPAPFTAPLRPPPVPARSLPPPVPLPQATPAPGETPSQPLPQPIPPTRRKGSRWGCLLGIALPLLIILAALGVWLLMGRSGNSMAGPLAFRESARKNAPGAFQKALAPSMQSRLGGINEVLWPTADAPVGWAFFFNTSLVAGAPEQKGLKPVLFYHPWADVGLLTLWKGPETMVDLELVPGSALRGEGPPFGSPGWAKEGYGPHGVGYTTAQTIRAFERTFADGTDLRKITAAAPDALRVACGSQMAQVVRSLVTFSQPMNNPVRMAYIRLMAEGATAVGQTRSTPSSSAEALRALPQEAWAAFKPTVMVDAGGKVLVMAHNGSNPDLFLGIVFQREEGALAPERLDLLSFNACYGGLK